MGLERPARTRKVHLGGVLVPGYADSHDGSDSLQ